MVKLSLESFANVYICSQGKFIYLKFLIESKMSFKSCLLCDSNIQCTYYTECVHWDSSIYLAKPIIVTFTILTVDTLLSYEGSASSFSFYLLSSYKHFLAYLKDVILLILIFSYVSRSRYFVTILIIEYNRNFMHLYIVGHIIYLHRNVYQNIDIILELSIYI